MIEWFGDYPSTIDQRKDSIHVPKQCAKNILRHLVVIGYLRSLLDNAAVVRYLSQAESTMLAEFQKIMDQAEMKATG